MKLTPRERAAVVAGLRLIQDQTDPRGGRPATIHDIMTQRGTQPALSNAELYTLRLRFLTEIEA